MQLPIFAFALHINPWAANTIYAIGIFCHYDILPLRFMVFYQFILRNYNQLLLFNFTYNVLSLQFNVCSFWFPLICYK